MFHHVPLYFYNWVSSSLQENENETDDWLALREAAENGNNVDWRAQKLLLTDDENGSVDIGELPLVPFYELDLHRETPCAESTEHSESSSEEDQEESLSIFEPQRDFPQVPFYSIDLPSTLDTSSHSQQDVVPWFGLETAQEMEEESVLASLVLPSETSPRLTIPTEIDLARVGTVVEQEIIDPTEPLIYEMSSLDEAYQAAADTLYQYLQPTNEISLNTVLDAIQSHPIICQIRYTHKSFVKPNYPLALFVKKPLVLLQKVYQAFPEAIGYDCSGVPLHHAIQHCATRENIEFLLQRYPNATRCTNMSHQTPLHLACQYYRDATLCHNLLSHYPTAGQLIDQRGWTPLHYACQNQDNTSLLETLIGPAVIQISTRDWERPLHVACSHGASLQVLRWLMQKDPKASTMTTARFDSILHCAIGGGASTVILKDLVEACPFLVEWTNEDDETPYALALRQGQTLEFLRPQ